MPISPLGARLTRYLWIILITVLMLVAAYVSIGRMVLPRLENYQGNIEAMLSEQLDMHVQASSLQGGWQGFQPTVKLTQISLTPGLDNGQLAAPVLNIENIDLQLDVVASLLAKTPIFSSLTLAGVQLELTQNEAGRWYLEGMQPGSGKGDALNWLLLQNQLLVKHLTITLKPNGDEPKELQIPEWGLKCGSLVCSSQGSLRISASANDTLQFAANSYGRPGSKDFQLNGYLKSPPFQLTEWLFLTDKLPLQVTGIESLMLGTELWFEWGNNQLLDVRGHVDLPEVKLGAGSGELVAFESLHSRFFWQKSLQQKDELWRLSLDDFTFNWGGQNFEPARRQVVMRQGEQGRIVQLWADRVALQPLARTLELVNSLPVKVRDALQELRPSGELVNVHFDYPLDDESKTPDFYLRADLDNVAVAAWKGAPSLVAVNGQLQVGAYSGQVNFYSDNLAMHFPRVFNDIWLFKRARGVINWQREGNTLWLKGRDLQLKGELGDVTGQFGFVSSRGEFEPRLSLLIGLENARLPAAMTFVPGVVIDPKVGDWLARAFSAGDVHRTRFVLEQSLVKGSPQVTRTLAMDVQARDVDFLFHPEWPKLTEADVAVQIMDKRVAVIADRANIFDLELNNIEANYSADAKTGSRLQATAAVKGALRDSWRILTDTPLQQTIFPLAKDFSFKGIMQGNVALDIPFKKPQQSRVKVDFLTRNARLAIPSLSVAADKIGGVFSYHSDRGLTARKVEANMFGYPLAMTINSQQTGQGLTTQFDFKGRLKATELAAWLPATLTAQLAGETDFTAALELGKGSANSLQINSNLQGVAVNLPEPFAKTVAQATPFSLNMMLQEPQLHTLHYADKLAYRLQLKNKNYHNGVVRLGPGKLAEHGNSGIEITGSLPMLDVKQWQQLFTGSSAGSGSKTTGDESKRQPSLLSNISRIDVAVERFRFLDRNFNQVTFNALQSKGDWQLAFNNEEAKGMLSYYPASNKPLAVDFNYLKLPAQNPAQNKTVQAEPTDILASWQPQQLPELDLRIQQLTLGQQPYGSWAFNSRSNDQGVTLEALSFDFKGMQGSGVVDWRYENNSHRSEFRGDVKIPNVATTLTKLQFSAAVEASDAKFSGQLAWPGSPAAFSLVESEGALIMSADEGRLADLKALPLLGVFNFNNLSRRLRLDFSDLFEKGFSFDEAKGAFKFDKGTMLLTKPLVIEGPSAKFKVEGQTDLRHQRFDHDVIVVLPVTDSIPVLVSLAGFPQIGIPVYLFNKSFGDMFDRFTSVNYRVSGPWHEPEIKLKNFFKSEDLKDTNSNAPVRRPKR